MMAYLTAAFATEVEHPEHGIVARDTWTIGIDRFGIESCLLHGFASQRDAKLGAVALEKCGVDWSGEKEDVIASVLAHAGGEGYEKYLRRIACEALPW